MFIVLLTLKRVGKNKPSTVWLFILDKKKRGLAGSRAEKRNKDDNYICMLVSGKYLDAPAGE